MAVDINAFAYTVLTLFFLVDPIGGIPVFISLTETHGEKEKISALRTGVIVGTITLITFGLGSDYIFQFFGFTLPAFRIAGGIILFIIAIEMIFGSRRHKQSSGGYDTAEMHAIGFVPVGIPLLAGPGSITASILMFATYPSMAGKLMTITAILVVMGLSYVLFHYSSVIVARIGKVGTIAISRIMGLMLTAISVQMVIDGILAVVNGSF